MEDFIRDFPLTWMALVVTAVCSTQGSCLFTVASVVCCDVVRSGKSMAVRQDDYKEVSKRDTITITDEWGLDVKKGKRNYRSETFFYFLYLSGIILWRVNETLAKIFDQMCHQHLTPGGVFVLIHSLIFNCIYWVCQYYVTLVLCYSSTWIEYCLKPASTLLKTN